MEHENIIRFICKAASQNGNVSVRLHYSGRGMYGETCLGISGDTDDLTEVIANTQVMAGTMIPEIANFSTDSMGMGAIYYWRGIKTPEGFVNEYDPEEDA